MTKIIAVSNEKGGVAKTTTVISLGAALVDLGNRVLLIDLDAQANLTLALGFEPGESEITSSNVMLDNAPLLSARRKTDVEHLDLIPSNSRIETSEQFLPVRTNFTTILKKAIANTANLPYDYILVDCPPALGAITQNALAAADLLLIPTQAEYFSAYALRNMMTPTLHIASLSQCWTTGIAHTAIFTINFAQHLEKAYLIPLSK